MDAPADEVLVERFIDDELEGMEMIPRAAAAGVIAYIKRHPHLPALTSFRIFMSCWRRGIIL
jgi:hypothetical protein